MLDRVSAAAHARIAGALYAVIFVIAPSGAGSATPLNITGTLACDAAIALIFLRLLRPVNARLAMLATGFRFLFVVMMGLNSLNFFGVLDLFGKSRSAAAFDYGYGLALAPFGVHLILTGCVLLEARFLPRLLGYLLILAGAAYSLFFWPPLGQALFMPYIVIPGVLGEGSLTLWLLIRGVNSQRWNEQSQETA